MIEIDPVVLVKIFFVTSIKFYHFAIISPWKRAKALCLNKNESCFMPSLVEIGLVVLEEKVFKLSKYFHFCLLFEKDMACTWTNLNDASTIILWFIFSNCGILEFNCGRALRILYSCCLAVRMDKSSNIKVHFYFKNS